MGGGNLEMLCSLLKLQTGEEHVIGVEVSYTTVQQRHQLVLEPDRELLVFQVVHVYVVPMSHRDVEVSHTAWRIDESYGMEG